MTPTPVQNRPAGQYALPARWAAQALGLGPADRGHLYTALSRAALASAQGELRVAKGQELYTNSASLHGPT